MVRLIFSCVSGRASSCSTLEGALQLVPQQSNFFHTHIDSELILLLWQNILSLRAIVFLLHTRRIALVMFTALGTNFSRNEWQVKRLLSRTDDENSTNARTYTRKRKHKVHELRVISFKKTSMAVFAGH